MRIKSALILSALAATTANAQVVLNEIAENPPGSGDEFYEYIEFYGRPGMSLDGLAIALLKGGNDLNGDGIPGNDPEIDEAFSLDGLSLGTNGMLVLLNDTGGFNFLDTQVPAETTIAFFSTQHIATSDTPGKLANDDSSTYVLVRMRPVDNFGGFTSSWRKDISPDENFDSHVDFGPPNQTFGRVLEPYQMVDDVAWSNSGGKEYSRDSEEEFTDTPGFNPDAISRLAFYGANPGLGTRRADEEWIRGELVSTTNLDYDLTEAGGPTGVDLTGTALTPGDFNDSGTVTQFRFVDGDVNFDGVSDFTDYCLAVNLVGATPDDTEPRDYDNNTPGDPSDDFSYTAWKYEGRAFNGLQVVRHMDTADDNASNAAAVTNEDIAALASVACLADINVDGFVNTGDFLTFLNGWNAQDPCMDFVRDGLYNTADFISFLNIWNAGCQ